MLFALFGGTRGPDDTCAQVEAGLVERANGDGSMYLVMEPATERAVQNAAAWVRQELGLPVLNGSGRRWERLGLPQITSSLIHFFGGNPADYVRRLAGSVEWIMIREALNRGAAVAASSAGSECLGGLAATRTF